ncbi:MAG: succinate dehydrogenase [Deltaproteobacteria bacterium]|nr:succinate dehydrogenase [Deltaproteobacteria bacterium]
MDRQRAYLLLRKAHTLTGVIPVGVFLVAHLVTSSKMLDGREAWNERVHRTQSTWGWPAVEWAAILVPLAAHAILGLWLLAGRRADVAPLASAPAWSSVAQRATALCAFAFIVLHLWEYRVQRSLGALPFGEMVDRLASSLEGRLLFVPYLLGISATVFHFANGLWRFSVSSGIARTPGAQRAAAIVLGLGGILMWICWLDLLAHFHAGGPLLGWLGGAGE